MAKKSKKNQKIFYLISSLLALVAICMIFVDGSAIIKDGEKGYVFTGIQATFGYSETSSGLGMSLTTIITQFSILNFLTYICLFTGLVLLIFKATKLSKKQYIDWIVIALFAISAVLYFFMPSFVIYGESVENVVNIALKSGATKSLMVGSIIGSISSFVAAIVIFAKKILAK